MSEQTVAPHTRVTLEVGQVSVSIETSVGWTPEMVDDALNRMRRSLVATSRQLGLCPDLDDSE